MHKKITDVLVKTVNQDIASVSSRECSLITFVPDACNIVQDPDLTVNQPRTEQSHPQAEILLDLSTGCTAIASGYVFSREETEILYTVFEEMIKGTEPILLEEIEKKLKGTLLLKKYGGCKVQNRVKYERFKYRRLRHN